MGRPVTRTITLVAGVANGYSLSQTLIGAGRLAMNGSLVNANSVGVPDTARRVVVHSNGNDSGLLITVAGLSRGALGNIPLTETMAGGNASDAVTTQDFEQVNSISFSGATASTVFAGTNGAGGSVWVPTDVNSLTKFEMTVAGWVLSGAPTWGIEVTYDDVYLTQLPSGILFPRAVPWPSLSALTGNAFDVITQGVRAVRLTLTVAPGSVQVTFTQQGN